MRLTSNLLTDSLPTRLRRNQRLSRTLDKTTVVCLGASLVFLELYAVPGFATTPPPDPGSGGGVGGIGNAVSASAPGAWAFPAFGFGLSLLAAQARGRADLAVALRRGREVLGWPFALVIGALLSGALAWRAGGLEGVVLALGPALVAYGMRSRVTAEAPGVESRAGAGCRWATLGLAAAMLASWGSPALALPLAAPWLALAMTGTLGRGFARAHRLLWIATAVGSLWGARALLDPLLARAMATASATVLQLLGAGVVLDGTTLITRGSPVAVTSLCAGTGVLLAPFVVGAMVATLWLPTPRSRTRFALGLFGAALVTNLLRIVGIGAAAAFVSRDSLISFHDQLGWALSLGLYAAFGLWGWRLRGRTPAA